MSLKDRSRDELEHDSIQAQLKIISSQVSANFEVIGIQLENILTEAKKTNGRITALEEVTSVIKFMINNKKIAILVFYALYNILNYTTVENALRIIQWIRLMI